MHSRFQVVTYLNYLDYLDCLDRLVYIASLLVSLGMNAPMEVVMGIKKVKLNILPFWPDELTITQAAEELAMNPRSLTTIRKGTERGEWLTLFKLVDYFSAKAGRQISLEELFEVERDGVD